MINIIWAVMFLIAVLGGLYQFVFEHNMDIFNQISSAIFLNAESAVKITIGLIGILSFWLGILKLVEETGLALKISNKLSPLFGILMKDIPQNSPAISTVVLNMAANFLGLDNAATPMGLKAMEELQKYNTKKDEASDAQILFMILNASSVTLIPITIFMYRAQMGANHPTDVFIPILLATSASTLTGFILIAFKQHISLKNSVLLKYLLGFIGVILTILGGFYVIDYDQRLIISSLIGNILLISLICGIIAYAGLKKINCYEAFINGAKEGFNVSIKILPYLVAMLVAIGVFRASGILDFLVYLIKQCCSLIGINADFADALPTAVMKPLSGSGARAMMIETMQHFGADSFAGFVSSVIQGSTETTFYVLTVYFGAVNISKTRYALKYALFSDFVGIIVAIALSYVFYAN